MIVHSFLRIRFARWRGVNGEYSPGVKGREQDETFVVFFPPFRC